MSNEEEGLEGVAARQWGAIRRLLRYGRGSMDPSRHREVSKKVEEHVVSATGSMSEEQQKTLSHLVRQMQATTCFDDDDEPTLVPLLPVAAGD